MSEVEAFCLFFAQCPHHLNPLNGGIRRFHGFESLRGVDYPFQFAMIVSIHVIPVAFNFWRTPSLPFQQRQRTTIDGRFIRVDEAGYLPAFHIVQDLTQKPMCRFTVTARGEIKIDGASAVNGTVQINPSTVNCDISFIEMPGAAP